MTALRALPGGSRPSSVLSASADLERAWHALCAASDAFAMSPLGDTDQLFRLRDAWVSAIGVYELARVRLQAAVARSEGRAWLRSLDGGHRG